MRSLGAPILLIASLLVGAIAAGGPSVSAQSDPIVSVDTVPDAGNTATTVGNIDPCRSTTSGSVFNVDVVIQQDASQEIAGFQANLLYNPLVLKVTVVNYNFLLASTGGSIWDVGEDPPDLDGDFLLAAATQITAPGGSYASGSGVLARVTLQAVGAGTSALDLTNVKLSDGSGSPIPPSDPVTDFYLGPVNDGLIAVGQPDTDGDGISDPCDPDDDNDGWTDDEETYMGTLVLVACPATATANDEDPDAWGPDFNDTQNVDAFDVFLLAQRSGTDSKSDPPPGKLPYSVRYDLNADAAINGLDVFRLTQAFNTICPS